MNKLALALMASLILLSTSCKKENDITPGNEENGKVKAYIFTNEYLSSSHDFNGTIPLRGTAIDSALILVYYFDIQVNGWFSSPGPGTAALYQTRYFLTPLQDSTEITLKAYSPTFGPYSGGTITMPKVKVIVAIADETLIGKKAPADFANYSATMKYFGLKE
jgi:hypothetical protein